MSIQESKKILLDKFDALGGQATTGAEIYEKVCEIPRCPF